MSWRVATPSLLARLRAVLPDMACVEQATVGALPRYEGRTSFASRGVMVDARGRHSDWGHDGEGLRVFSFLATSLVAPIVAPVVTSVVASVLTAVIAVAAVRMAPARVAPLGSGRRRRRRRRDHGVVPAVVGTPLVLTLTLAEPRIDGHGVEGLVQRRPVDGVQRKHKEHERDREGRVLPEVHPSPVDNEYHDQVGEVAVDAVYLLHGEIPRRLVVRVHADRETADTRVHFRIVVHEFHAQRRQFRHASRERRGALEVSYHLVMLAEKESTHHTSHEQSDGGATHFPFLSTEGVRVYPIARAAACWSNVLGDGLPNPQAVHEGEPLNFAAVVSLPAALQTVRVSPLKENSELLKMGLNIWFTDRPDYPRPEFANPDLEYAPADIQNVAY